MAFNSWDKLARAQIDYPKPKFALAVVDKALKKQPNNPYLLTWKADLALQQSSSQTGYIVESLGKVHQQPIADMQLLVYMYRTIIEGMRRLQNHGPGTNSVGSVALNSWQSAAKAMPRKNDRMALWNTLFSTAMQEYCWEDVRFAILQQNKEATPNKKQSHYSLILATQIAAEQKILKGGPGTQMGQLQQSVALKLMKQAYTAAPGDPIAVSNIRDLRFMASIFQRQHRSTELHDLWNEPPEKLAPILERHRQDLLMVMIKGLRNDGNWTLLADQCTSAIAETVHNLRRVGGNKNAFWELSAWRWDIWEALLQSMCSRSVQDARVLISSQMSLCFGEKLESKDRAVQLTYMRLRQYVGGLTLEDCKEYFQQHSGLNSCFNDLRPFVCSLWPKERVDFLDWIYDYLIAETGTSELENLTQATRHYNVAKFYYMITTSTAKVLARDDIHQVFQFATQALTVAPQNPELGSVAIYTLLNIHHRLICTDDLRTSMVTKVNCRVLLQATMLARHLVEKDKEKQNRTLALLAARLHLNVGLGTIAFRLFRHTKCKEMLVDTFSPYMLARISQTHPFDVKGYGGFSAVEELEKVVGTIERMERKTSDYLYTDTPTFLWDQATDTLELKRKLKSSLTKHMCVFERRRIARLRGESVETLPKLTAKEFHDISDNIDRTIFPNFEAADVDHRALQYIMPTGLPNMKWVIDSYWVEEWPTKHLWGEELFGGHNVLEHSKANGQAFLTRSSGRSCSEHMMKDLWTTLCGLVVLICEDTKTPRWPEGLNELPSMLLQTRKIIEDRRIPSDTTLKPEDEVTMFHENLLMSCYGWLSYLRAVNKATEVLHERVLKKKSHPLFAALPMLKDLHTRLSEECKVCYQAVRDMAQSYMDLIKSRGLSAIKAQVRWGKTGEQLKQILSDDDVDYYAKEYMESALEAWSGVLKVKLK